MKLRERFASRKVKITSLRPTGTKSAEADYDELDLDGNVISSGTAACFNIDAVEIDDDDCLMGNSGLSAGGDFIVEHKVYDKTGLGRKK